MKEIRAIITFTRKDGEILALLEKTIESPERYIIAHYWDEATRTWGRGEYFRDQLDAMQRFVDAAR